MRCLRLPRLMSRSQTGPLPLLLSGFSLLQVSKVLHGEIYVEHGNFAVTVNIT